VFVCIFLAGWVTKFIGLDTIFGAFLVRAAGGMMMIMLLMMLVVVMLIMPISSLGHQIGVVLPRDEALIKVVEKIEDVVTVVFLPMVGPPHTHKIK
jgi:Kef-type K+ transport system membrane component KefB